MNRDRWVEFRCVALRECRWRACGISELLDRAGIEYTRNTQRMACRNLTAMVDRGFLARGAEGYTTTPRGRRVHEDVQALEHAPPTPRALDTLSAAAL